MRILWVAGLLALGTVASCKGATAPNQGGTILVVITPSSVPLAPGAQVQLHAKVTGPSGITQGVSWRSQDPTLASVNGTGLVTALQEGTALIRVTWDEDEEEFSLATIIITSTPVVTESPSAVRVGSKVRAHLLAVPPSK